MDVHKKNVQKTANVHETSTSEKAKEEENAECIFCQKNLFNFVSSDRWVHCMLCFQWAHEDHATVGPLINDDIMCGFCSPQISLPQVREKISLVHTFL
jgi:hypothetical protein